MGQHRKDPDEYIKEFNEQFGNEFEFVTPYSKMTDKITLKHKICGSIITVNPYDVFRKKHLCEKCFKNNDAINKDIKFKEKVKELVGDEYTVLGKYEKGHTKILIRHNKCGYEYNVTPVKFVSNSRRCPNCSHHIKLTPTDIKNRIISLVGDEYTIININDSIKNIRDENIELKHSKCGNSFLMKIGNFLNGNRCPYCYATPKKTISQFKDEIKNLYNDEYTVLSDEYVSTHSKILMKHNKCGYEWWTKPNNILQGYKCPKCSNGPISEVEVEVYNFISSIYNKTIERSNREIIKPYELDMYFPDLKLAIEFDGLYWHSEEGSSGKCDRSYHLMKTNLCEKNNIKLIHLFENEWLDNRPLIECKLKNLLKVLEVKRIRASKCIIKEIDPNIKSEFLNAHHIQGNDHSTINIGLYYKNILMSVMTFCKPRIALGHKDKKDSLYYELSRFCIHTDYKVYGAFNKCLQYFESKYKWEKIITYADRRWSSTIGSNIYEKNNFILDHISKPSYWYVKNGNVYYRYQFKKSNLKELFPEIYNESLSESQIMQKAKYTRIWDCGNLVYIKNNN